MAGKCYAQIIKVLIEDMTEPARLLREVASDMPCEQHADGGGVKQVVITVDVDRAATLTLNIKPPSQ